MDKIYYVDTQSERDRYLEHNNDIEDFRYQKFVSPITDYVISNINKDKIGLDFGSGTGPVVSKVLHDSGYHLAQYDPFFAPDQSVLNYKYDFIVCCEVIEHFNDPGTEFNSLYEMLVDGGHLLCMTQLYDDKVAFDKWYYRRDPTHVFIYQSKTISFITELYCFKTSSINSRLIVFQK